MEFTAQIYQLSKDGNNETFRYSLRGTADQAEFKPENIAELLASKLYKLFEAQNRIKNKSGKNRFYKLAKGKPLFFFFSSELVTINTELSQDFLCRFDLATFDLEGLTSALTETITILMDETKL